MCNTRCACHKKSKDRYASTSLWMRRVSLNSKRDEEVQRAHSFSSCSSRMRLLDYHSVVVLASVPSRTRNLNGCWEDEALNIEARRS